MIDTILGVANSLWGLREKLRGARRERRDRIADHFERISENLAAVVTSLKAQEVPHGSCAELDTYAQALPDIIGKEVGRAEADRLGERLQEAHQVERLVTELHERPDRAAELAKLEEASGVFRALAGNIRAAA